MHIYTIFITSTVIYSIALLHEKYLTSLKVIGSHHFNGTNSVSNYMK